MVGVAVALVVPSYVLVFEAAVIVIGRVLTVSMPLPLTPSTVTVNDVAAGGVWVAVVMVRVEVALPPGLLLAIVTEAGLNEYVAPAGRPAVMARLAVPPLLLLAVTVTWKVTEPAVP